MQISLRRSTVANEIIPYTPTIPNKMAVNVASTVRVVTVRGTAVALANTSSNVRMRSIGCRGSTDQMAALNART